MEGTWKNQPLLSGSSGAGRAEMMQVSMFIVVVFSTAHSLTLVGVLVSPLGMGQIWQRQAQLFLTRLWWPPAPQHGGVPRSPAFAGPGTQHLPAQVAAVGLPPDTTSSNSSFSPLFTRKKPRGWSH